MPDNIIANSPGDRRQVNDLINKNIPSYRQAYSDRTAWLMACLSELAYIKFNPPFSSSQQKLFCANIEKLASDILGDNEKRASLIKLVNMIGHDSEENRKQLGEELEIIGMRLEKTFDSDGTQAILVSSNKFITLAFRGTEATSMEDIKTDAKAKTTSYKTEGKLHTGFNDAFGKVAVAIQKEIEKEEWRGKPLFITGHSLGGALATIAAKRLSHKGGIAACYTYGSPKVGNDEWTSKIKTPIYRLVNAADCVPMLPPGGGIINPCIWLSRIISKCQIPWLSSMAGCFSKWLSNFGGYIHAGDMRYLTNCGSGSYDDVKLLYGVSPFRRIRGYGIKKLPWKKFLSDHSISIYRKKLMIVAEQRNKKSG